MTAVENAHPECVVLLLAHKANVDVLTSDNKTIIMGAALHCQYAGIKFIDARCQCIHLLLDNGDVAVNWNFYLQCKTALMLATWNVQLTRLLIEAGAFVNYLDNIRRSALWCAIKGKSSEVVELLLDSGANPNVVDNYGNTPLHQACSSHTLVPAIVESLLRHGTDIGAVNGDGKTALQCVLSRSVRYASRETVIQLIDTYEHIRALEVSSAEWIRLARNERNRPQAIQQRRRRRH